MTADDVLEIIGRLDAAGVRWWVHGGWGMDALLGKETRPHDDLDLAVPRADIDRRDAQLLAERFGLRAPSGPWPGIIHPKRVRGRPRA